MLVSAPPRPWSTEEDSLLRQAVATYGEEPGMWKTISAHVPGRTNKACRKRWLHSLSPTIKKTPWTAQEDATLLALYNSHTPPRWSLIARQIPGRTDDACSKRYREALDPQLKRDQWSHDEDATLLHLTLQLGSKWTQVGQAMGRSSLACRNRWRLLQRRQQHHPPESVNPPIIIHHPLPPNNISTSSSLTGALSPIPALPIPNPSPPQPPPPLVTSPTPRLSSHLPVTPDPCILPYACGYPRCWSSGQARFSIASQLAEHRRVAHSADPDNPKVFRCALNGCGKAWKNINGIQYHLQISKAHFKAALNARQSQSPLSKKPKEHPCPHQGCTNTYKQRTGLQYHLAHGHPENFAQLDVLPPGLMT